MIQEIKPEPTKLKSNRISWTIGGEANNMLKDSVYFTVNVSISHADVKEGIRLRTIIEQVCLGIMDELQAGAS